MAAHIGPYSRPGPLARIDHRTREGRFLRAVRTDLTSHVGGAPTATERALIERAVWLSLRVAQLDAKMAAGNSFSEHDSRTYLAWANALTRTLRELGLQPAAERTPSLAEILAAGREGRAA